MTNHCVNGIISTMKTEENKEIEIHRYGLRIPKRIFKLIENMAWESRLSINFMLNDLIVYALEKKLRDHKLDVSLALYDGSLHYRDDLKWITEVYENDSIKFEELLFEMFEIFREYRDWKDANT